VFGKVLGTNATAVPTLVAGPEKQVAELLLWSKPPYPKSLTVELDIISGGFERSLGWAGIPLVWQCTGE
jgi:hypothetical protein